MQLLAHSGMTVAEVGGAASVGDLDDCQVTHMPPVVLFDRLLQICSVKTRDVKNRVAEALRLAAQGLWRAQNYFGDLYRRWKARLGSPKTITDMAYKLARIFWHVLKFKEPFNPEVFAQAHEKMKRKKLARLQSFAANLNCQLVPNP